MASYTHSPNEVSASWTYSAGETAASWTYAADETSSSYLVDDLMEHGWVYWEGISDKYEDVVSGYYSGVHASSAKWWEDLG